jgi:hypothetical protein
MKKPPTHKVSTNSAWLLEFANLLSEEEGAALERAVLGRRAEQRVRTRSSGTAHR